MMRMPPKLILVLLIIFNPLPCFSSPLSSTPPTLPKIPTISFPGNFYIEGILKDNIAWDYKKSVPQIHYQLPLFKTKTGHTTVLSTEYNDDSNYQVIEFSPTPGYDGGHSFEAFFDAVTYFAMFIAFSALLYHYRYPVKKFCCGYPPEYLIRLERGEGNVIIADPRLFYGDDYINHLDNFEPYETTV